MMARITSEVEAAKQARVVIAATKTVEQL